MDEKTAKHISKTYSKIETIETDLQKSNWVVSKSKKEKLKKELVPLKEEMEKYIQEYNDPDVGRKVRDQLLKGYIDNSIFTKLAENTEKMGESLQQSGKKIAKTGAKTTAITWTPFLYAGYKVGKSVISKNNDKQDITPEQEFIELIKECEIAFNEDKIDEETLKYYITDYANNRYRI
ncbi:hypothetical protein [Abyssicoccus albus]|uniref:hypothetical protein n=1 Tax=Abyssicoccus albus TaxID=1817405 RepID=UPI00097E25C2|nr:hypothetical protein [Abyssicoccus albus]AQL56444.1 hypothetical protein BVH56_05675 [Abyssicoccus albus]